jgi:hypothetical protein
MELMDFAMFGMMAFCVSIYSLMTLMSRLMMRLLFSIEAGGAVFCAGIWAVTANVCSENYNF